RYETGDFNGDGKTDLIHFDVNNYVHLWQSNGDGTFSIKSFTPGGGYEVGVNNYRYETGDFNGDGKTDLIHFDVNNYVHLWQSNGDGKSIIFISDVTITEGNSGTTNAVFTVTLSNQVDTAVTVNYATANGTATTADNDYTAIPTTALTFNAGETSKTITVAVNGDTKVESNETFFLNLSNLQTNGSNVTLADNQGQGTITDDDSASIAITDVTITEGNSGTTNAVFTVSLSSAVDTAITLDYTTANGTATTEDNDYTAIPTTTLTFNPGETSKTITVAVNGDNQVELNETFFLNLSNLQTNGSNVTLADNQGQGTINNDENFPTNLNLSNNTVAENSPLNTLIGNFTTTDPDTGNTFSYSLVTGTGDTDNSLFTIDGNQLKVNGLLDYETQNNYSIRVKTTDQGGLSYEKQLTVSVSDVNENPTNLNLSNNTVAENSPLNTLIGNFTTTDPDTGNTFTYSLVTGTGSTDNSLFTIDGNQLKVNGLLDYETKPNYSILVRTTDQGGLSYEKQLTVSVTNLREQGISVDKNAITFGTPLSQYRQGWSNSNLVRPKFADRFRYIDITNTGVNAEDILAISNIEVKASNVTTNANFSQGDILLNPGQTWRVQLTYAPTAARESFNLNDGLVIHSNAINNTAYNVALTGKSTFNSDITYNGKVDRGDLAPLQAAFNSSIGNPKYDPTADINGDSKINLGDFLVLNSDYGLSLI
ncbi:MAG: cadherin domain-containing protein, partial [Microcystis sp. M069S2]|uniref:Calx-beta domain-containing protein n=2 Tax=Microcystis TaxID=1125 RepID=UPI0025886A50